MILITGASSGIGAACAEIFAEQGQELLLVARRGQRLEELAGRLGKSKCHVRVLDVGDGRAVESFARQETELLSRVKVLVNNAGLAAGLNTIDEVGPAQWDRMIDVNVKGLLGMTHAVLPHMLARGDGHIVNLGSVAGHHVYPKGNVYCATKYAVHAISQALRVDLLGKNIRVTEISPGMVETEFSEVRLGDKDKARAVYAGMTPLTARDVAETVAWAVARPAHVNVQEIVLYPTDQAAPTLVHREVHS